MYFNEVFGISAKQIYDPHPCLQTTLPRPYPHPTWVDWVGAQTQAPKWSNLCSDPHQLLQIDIARMVSIQFFSFQRLQY